MPASRPSPGHVLLVLLVACLAPIGVVMATGLMRSPAHDRVETADGDGSGTSGSDPRQVAVRLGIEEDDAGSTTVPSAPTTSSTTSTTSTTAPPTTPPTTTPPTTAPPSSSPPTTAPPAPPPAPSATDQVVALVNAARSDAGCDPLRIDSRLTAAAQGHSDDMAEQGYFSHTSLDGRTFADRVRAAGYPRPGGENIAQGQRTPEEVHEAWMNSEGHRANILNCNFTAIGVGLNSSARIWTQNFGY